MLTKFSYLQGYFMYVTNQKHYGHLVNPDNFETSHLFNDMYNMFENPTVSILILFRVNI